MDIRISKVEAVLLNIPRRSDTGRALNLSFYIVKRYVNSSLGG